MNYLAHCFLSCSNEDVLLGNFITDFLSREEEHHYKGNVQEGIMLHRKIDSFTDSHPVSLKLRAMLRTRHSKYASVVVDLVWDYFLSKNWSSFSDTSLDDFSNNVYRILQERKNELPDELKDQIDKMIDSDFLRAYANKTRMLSSLKWMDRRVSFKSNFAGAIEDINENEAEMEEMFMIFFPELIEQVKQSCDCL